MSEVISFVSHGIRLAGTLYGADTAPPWPAVVGVHPALVGERTAPFYEHLRNELPRHGIAVLLFDRRGSGGSGGDFDTADFEDLASDVVSAVEYLQTRIEIDRSRIGLHGTSQGAWIAPIAASRKPDIALIVAVSASGVPPAEQMDYGVAYHLEQAGYQTGEISEALRLRGLVNDYFRGRAAHADVRAQLMRFEREPWFRESYLYASAELPRDLSREKWHHEMDYEPLPVWRNVRQPTLFLFAETDAWVPVGESMVLYRRTTAHLEDITLVQISGADHLMHTANGEISEKYLDILVKWLLPRLTGSHPPASS